jgi:hypothetical protein
MDIGDYDPGGSDEGSDESGGYNTPYSPVSFSTPKTPKTSSYSSAFVIFAIVIFFLLIFALIYTYWYSQPAQFLVQNNQTTNYLALRSNTGASGTSPTLDDNYVSCGGNSTEATARWVIIQAGLLSTLYNSSIGGYLNYASATAGTLITCSSTLDKTKMFMQVTVPTTLTVYFRSVQNTDLILIADANSSVFKKDEALYLASYPAPPSSTGVATFSPPQSAIFSYVAPP